MADNYFAQDVVDMINKIGSGDHSDALLNFNDLMDNKVNSKLNDRTKELASQLFGASPVEESRAPHDKKTWVPKEEKKKGDKNFKEDVDSDVEYFSDEDIENLAAEMIESIEEKTGLPVDQQLFEEMFGSFLEEEIMYEGDGKWSWKKPTGFSNRGVELNRTTKRRQESEVKDANKSSREKHSDAVGAWKKHMTKPIDVRHGSPINRTPNNNTMELSRSDSPEKPQFKPKSNRIANTARRLKPANDASKMSPRIDRSTPRTQDKNED